MTTPDEVQRVWRVVEAIPAINDLSAQYQNDIAEAILSERAELLAAVERMRHALVMAGMHIETSPGAYEDRAKLIVQNIRAALTTGEEK